jgi:hypothetical protein
MIIPVITLWQPWASLIALKYKTIETRTHNKLFSLKGKIIGIHAGQSWDKDWYEAVKDLLDMDKVSLIEKMKRHNEIPFGKILCTAYVSKYETHLNPAETKPALIECWTRRAGLFLKEIKQIDSPVLEGSQGIWYYDTINRCKVVKSKENNQLSIAV